MPQLKSTLKQLNPIDVEKEIVINTIRADRQVVEMHQKRLTELFKNETTEQINARLQSIITRENVFNAIMEEIARNFEVTYDETELKNLEEKVKLQFSGRPDNVIHIIAQKIITKTLIFQKLGIEWNISCSDDEVNASLEQYYKHSNQSIREYKENKEKFENIRNIILEEKIANELLKRYTKVKIDWERIKKQQEEMIARQRATQNQPKSEDKKPN